MELTSEQQNEHVSEKVQTYLHVHVYQIRGLTALFF